MIDGKPLAGLRILVAEDDYYLATDTRQTLKECGGVVVGPFGRSEKAISALKDSDVDLAVIDINLGDGPVFDLARNLRAANIPFLFATGYDAATIPDDFRGVARLEKPFSSTDLVRTVAGLAAAQR